MIRTVEVQDRGRTLTLSVGVTRDMPDVVADGLIGRGYARKIVDEPGIAAPAGKARRPRSRDNEAATTS